MNKTNKKCLWLKHGSGKFAEILELMRNFILYALKSLRASISTRFPNDVSKKESFNLSLTELPRIT